MAPIVGKLARFAAVVASGAFVAGVYGAAHDQVSYSISNEYFTALKFEQFQIAPSLHGRAGAAIVGFLATWWVGALCAVVLAPFCLWDSTARESLRLASQAFFVVFLVALFAGAIGLAGAAIQLPSRPPSPTWLPQPLSNPRAFWMVGALHSASYLGGAIGSAVAVLYTIIQRRRRTAPTHERSL